MLNRSYLLVPNGEFALRLLVCLRVLVKSLDCIIVENFFRELDIPFSVFVSRVYLGIVRKSCECFIQGLVHLLRGSLEEAATATNEHRVSGKHSAILAILEEKAYAILGVTRSM
jgi:hypothetical protein